MRMQVKVTLYKLKACKRCKDRREICLKVGVLGNCDTFLRFLKFGILITYPLYDRTVRTVRPRIHSCRMNRPRSGRSTSCKSERA